jgi:hypothetical protein
MMKNGNVGGMWEVVVAALNLYPAISLKRMEPSIEYNRRHCCVFLRFRRIRSQTFQLGQNIFTGNSEKKKGK